MATTSRVPTSGLVCDDRAAVRRMVAALLLRCGYDSAVEIDSAAGLRTALAGLRPTVAVVGLPLLGMGGLAVVKDLRTDHPASRLLLLSGFDELSSAAVEAGATALVPEDDPMLLQVHLLAVLEAAVGPAVVALPDVGQGTPPSARSGAGAVSGTGNRRTNPSL